VWSTSSTVDKFCWQHDWHVVTKFSESKVYEKVPAESALILEKLEFVYNTESSLRAKKIDPASRFNTIPACGGKTDGRTDIILRLSCLNGWPRWRRARSEVVPVRRASQSTPGCCRGTCAQVPAQMRAADWTIRQRHQWRHLQPQQQPCSFYWLHRCCPKTPFYPNIRQYARLYDFNQQSKQKVWQWSYDKII